MTPPDAFWAQNAYTEGVCRDDAPKTLLLARSTMTRRTNARADFSRLQTHGGAARSQIHLFQHISRLTTASSGATLPMSEEEQRLTALIPSGLGVFRSGSLGIFTHQEV